MEVVLTNRPAEKQTVLRALESFARQHQLPAAVVHAADLSLEEHLTNVMRYAFEDKNLHDIRVRLELLGNCLVVEVEDDGKPFDPLNRPQVDTALPLEEKPIGGLGIHLIRQFMDEVQYCRVAGRNLLRMRKRFESKSSGGQDQ